MAMPTSLFEETARQLFLLKPRATARRTALIPGDAQPEAESGAAAEPRQERDNAEEQLVREGMKAAVRRILASMPELNRAILRALYLDGKSLKEVSAELGVPESYIRTMVVQAKARFRDVLLGGAASLLSAVQSDGMAAKEFAVGQVEANPTTKRFQELVAAKYTRGLTGKERLEMKSLEARMENSESSFYRPILDRARNSASRAGKKRRIA